MIDASEYIQFSFAHPPLDIALFDAWFELNYRLQEEASDAQINQAFVEQWMMRVWTIVSPRPQCFWLFLARINELALLCASRYVDCCDFAAADEFLMSKSSIFSQVEGAGTADFRESGCCAARGRERMLAEMTPGPLLHSLYDILKRSGYMTEGYMLSVCLRTEKIAQVARMLRALGIGTTEQIAARLSFMGLDQRRSFQSKLCRFNQKTFNEIGRALHLFMHFGKVDGEYVSKYLRR